MEVMLNSQSISNLLLLNCVYANMKGKLIVTCLLMALLLPACEKDSAIEILSDCPALAEMQIIEEGAQACHFNLVYLYRGDTYYTCECCDCGKINMAFDCNMRPLCEFDENCMNDFDQNALFLFLAQ